MAKKKSSKKKKSDGGGKGWLVLIAILVAGSAGWFFSRPAQVLVPRVLGATVEEARDLIAKSDLKVTVKEVAGEGAPGLVTRQFPDPGVSVPRTSMVSIEVTKSVGGTKVPKLVGKTRSQAEDSLTRLGLRVLFKESKSDKVAIGQVISQNPRAESMVAPGSQVTLVISAGKKQQVVPKLSGLPLELARKLLKERGLGLSVQYVARAGFRPGDPVSVLRSEPEAGEKLSPGSKVTVFLPVAVQDSGTGGQTARYHAPQLEGRSVAEARKIAQQRGVHLKVSGRASESSTITFQDPPPGDPLYGNQPTVVVQTVASAVVPGVAGLSEAQARARVEKADLTVGSVKRVHGDVAGEVLGQSPSAGIETVAGSRVDLVVADPSLSPATANVGDPKPTPAFTPDPWVE